MFWVSSALEWNKNDAIRTQKRREGAPIMEVNWQGRPTTPDISDKIKSVGFYFFLRLAGALRLAAGALRLAGA